jgi:hypothetical protein
MTSAAHNDSYGDPRWRYRHGPGACWGWSRWGWNSEYSDWRGGNGDAATAGAPPWATGHPFWQPPFIPRPVLIVLTILGFMLWWPVGLVLLVITLCRQSIFCGYRRWGGWQNASGPARAWKNRFGGESQSSGNRAFDEYRAETLHRLEEEQKEFAEFLERLRFAKDKAEFDQFMNERGNRPHTDPPAEPAG